MALYEEHISRKNIDDLIKFINTDNLLRNSPLRLGSSKTLTQRTPAELDALQLEVVNTAVLCNGTIIRQIVPSRKEKAEEIKHSILSVTLVMQNIVLDANETA